jgi:hypothetical protein
LLRIPFDYNDKPIPKTDYLTLVQERKQTQYRSILYDQQKKDSKSDNKAESAFADEEKLADQHDIVANRLAIYAAALEFQRIWRGHKRRVIYETIANHSSWSWITTRRNQSELTEEDNQKKPPTPILSIDVNIIMKCLF